MGLSDPIDLPRHRYRDSAVTWLDGVLDVLGLGTVALLGHSGGGMWALWYALARPDRVERLVLIGPPGLPNTRCPMPMRLAATPGLGQLLSRLLPPSPKSVAVRAPRGPREGDSRPLPRSGRPNGGHPSRSDRRPSHHRRASRVRIAIRLAIHVRIPTLFACATRPTAPPGRPRRWSSGAKTSGWASVADARAATQTNPTRATGSPANRARAMARAAYTDRRGGRELRALRAVRLWSPAALPNWRSALEFIPKLNTRVRSPSSAPQGVCDWQP